MKSKWEENRRLWEKVNEWLHAVEFHDVVAYNNIAQDYLYSTYK